jgi:hypothetical protein
MKNGDHGWSIVIIGDRLMQPIHLTISFFCRENTFSTVYSGPEAKGKRRILAHRFINEPFYNTYTIPADYQHIMTVLQQLETNARASGLLSLSNNAPEEGKSDQPPLAKNLATRNSETMQAVEQNFTERSRLVANVQAAINTSTHRVSH